jgi:hypothetical protein
MITLLLALLTAPDGIEVAAKQEVIEEIESADIAPMTDQDTWFGEAFPQFDRVFNTLTARTTRPKSVFVGIIHRTDTRLGKEPFYNYLGFDAGGLKIGLQARYGIIDGFDVGFARLNGTNELFDTYELDGRLQLLKAETGVVDLAVRAGGTWFAEKDNQALAYFGQLLVDRVVANRMMVTAGLMYHSDSSNAKKKDTDTNYSLGASFAIDLRLSSMLAFDVEIATNLSGYGEQYPVFTIGPKVVTNRHTFALVFTNSQYVLADGIITNSFRDMPKTIIGFNINREIGL